jgi:fatty acid desaturase
MIIGLPSFYGGFMTIYFGLTQHAGLAEDVLDHRLNSRTVYMNPIFRFLYWNMNYHVEHHMFPMAPYHALPQLHEAIKADCPPAYPNTLVAYREILFALYKQTRDPRYFVKRELPSSARAVPYNHDTQIIAAE